MKHAQTTNYETNRLKYRWFAENRRRCEATINADFDRLMADPNLVALDFMATDPRILMLQTPIIDILHDGAYHRIGAFVIMISRRYMERSWHVDYRFRNLHGMLYPGNNRAQVHHPHISNIVDGEEFGPNVGYFCTEARGALEKPLKGGLIADTYPTFLNILTTFTEEGPFYPVEHWPVVEKVGIFKGESS